MGFRSSGFYFKTLPIYTRFSRLKNIRIIVCHTDIDVNAVN